MKHKPYVVPLELYAENRQQLLSRLRDILHSQNQPVSGVILLEGGSEQLHYCSDGIVLFRQESYFAYLFGVKEPGFYGAINVASGQSILFIPRLSKEYAVWLGKIHPPAYFKDLYGVDAVCYVDELPDILGKQKESHDAKAKLFLLYGLNTDSGNYSKPASFPNIETFATDLETLHPVVSECRARKSKLEIEVMRYTNQVSSAAHVEVMRIAKPGMKEYHLESTFQHYVYFEGGCRHCSYTCICATGENRVLGIKQFQQNTAYRLHSVEYD